MNAFEFATESPWWALLYLALIVGGIHGLRGLITIVVTNNSKSGYNVDTGPVDMGRGN